MDPDRDTSHAHVGSEIAEDHALLQQTMQRLSQAQDIDATLGTLDELKTLLERHFVAEEAADGLAANVGESAPQLVARVNELLGQHKQFLTKIGSLVQRAEAIQTATTELETAIHELVRELDEHEKAETKLLVDSVYNDIGPSD